MTIQIGINGDNPCLLLLLSNDPYEAASFIPDGLLLYQIASTYNILNTALGANPGWGLEYDTSVSIPTNLPQVYWSATKFDNAYWLCRYAVALCLNYQLIDGNPELPILTNFRCLMFKMQNIYPWPVSFVVPRKAWGLPLDYLNYDDDPCLCYRKYMLDKFPDSKWSPGRVKPLWA